MKLIDEMYDTDMEMAAMVADCMLTVHPEKLVSMGFVASGFNRLSMCAASIMENPYLDDRDDDVYREDILDILLVAQAGVVRSGLDMAKELRARGFMFSAEEVSDLLTLLNEVIAGETSGR